MKPTFITSRLHLVRELMSRHKVVRGYLFGSSVNGSFNDSSDIDVLVDVDGTMDPVELGEHLWNLQFELEELFGRKVDLLTSRSLKNPVFIKRVNETKELVYEH